MCVAMRSGIGRLPDDDYLWDHRPGANLWIPAVGRAAGPSRVAVAGAFGHVRRSWRSVIQMNFNNCAGIPIP